MKSFLQTHVIYVTQDVQNSQLRTSFITLPQWKIIRDNQATTHVSYLILKTYTFILELSFFDAKHKMSEQE